MTRASRRQARCRHSRISTAPSWENSSCAGMASHSGDSSPTSSSDSERRKCRASFPRKDTGSPRPTPCSAAIALRRASRMAPSPQRLVGGTFRFPTEACHTGRPELMVSHLLTVKIKDHGRSSERYASALPEARAKGLAIAYCCIVFIGIEPFYRMPASMSTHAAAEG